MLTTQERMIERKTDRLWGVLFLIFGMLFGAVGFFYGIIAAIAINKSLLITAMLGLLVLPIGLLVVYLFYSGMGLLAKSFVYDYSRHFIGCKCAKCQTPT